LDDDRKAATLNLLVNKQPATGITLHARDLDSLLALLGEARARLAAPVPFQPPQDAGTRDVMVLDPGWRTEPLVHPSLNGITLRLRHPGFGWMTFLLPWHEVKNLGEWLSKTATPPQSS
jgi:hypothetical protein